MDRRYRTRNGRIAFVALLAGTSSACSLLTSFGGLVGGGPDHSSQDLPDSTSEVATEAATDADTKEAGDAAVRVLGFTLVDTDTRKDLQALTDGLALLRSALPANFSVRADTSPAVLGTVVFYVDGAPVTIEREAPYYVGGNSTASNSITPWRVADGNHTLAALPYSSGEPQGELGTGLQVTFSIDP